MDGYLGETWVNDYTPQRSFIAECQRLIASANIRMYSCVVNSTGEGHPDARFKDIDGNFWMQLTVHHVPAQTPNILKEEILLYSGTQEFEESEIMFRFQVLYSAEEIERIARFISTLESMQMDPGQSNTFGEFLLQTYRSTLVITPLGQAQCNWRFAETSIDMSMALNALQTSRGLYDTLRYGNAHEIAWWDLFPHSVFLKEANESIHSNLTRNVGFGYQDLKCDN